MKRLRKCLIGIVAVLLLLVVLVWVLSGNKYDKSFDNDFPRGIRFGMTEAEVAEVIGNNYTKEDVFDDRIIMKYPDGTIFRLDNDKLTSVFIAMPKTQAISILKKYGDVDKKKNGFYFWYGTVDNVKCSLCSTKNRSTSGIDFGIK